MGIRATLTGGVNAAFTALADLLEDFTFTRGGEYSPLTGEVAGEQETVTVKGVLTQIRVNQAATQGGATGNDAPMFEYQLLVKAADLPVGYLEVDTLVTRDSNGQGFAVVGQTTDPALVTRIIVLRHRG